jgi:hypothetical protein
MAVTAVICSRRDDGDWRDLYLALHSILVYTDMTVWVGWQGPQRPSWPSPYVQLARQPDRCSTFGAAYEWALDQTAGPWILANDDIVLRPDTAELLLEDVCQASKVGPVGFVAARFNYGRRDQLAMGNSRRLEEAACVAPVFAWAPADAFDGIDWPDCNWYSDDVLCHDMAVKGRRHWMSRAYVHHIGERSTRQHGESQDDLNRDGRQWVSLHRPDFLTR